MTFIFIILHCVLRKMRLNIKAADNGTQIEVLPWYRNTYDIIEFLYLVRNYFFNCFNNLAFK